LKIFIKVTGKVLVKFAASVDQELNQWPSAYKFNSFCPDYHMPTLFVFSSWVHIA
jgi:hypothetical protein